MRQNIVRQHTARRDGAGLGWGLGALAATMDDDDGLPTSVYSPGSFVTSGIDTGATGSGVKLRQQIASTVDGNTKSNPLYRCTPLFGS